MPRRQWHEYSGCYLWEGPDEFRLLVDAERGILLGVTSLFQGRAFAGKEFVDIAFGEPLPLRDDRWEAISEVIRLLYSAQYSFSTVRATVREWQLHNEKWSQITAVNPTKLRTERIGDSGQSVGLSIYDGGVWWRYSSSTQAVRTNAPVSSLPPGLDFQVSPRPFNSSDMVYRVMDAEYGISAKFLFNPSPFIYSWWLEPTGRTDFAGREAIRVQGSPNGNNGHRYWWEKVHSCELLVDAERGTLLGLVGNADDAKYVGHEVTEIEYDDPINEDAFRFTPPPGARVTVEWRPG